MARLGLGPEWRCLMANDISEKKAKAYAANFPPAEEFVQQDVCSLNVRQLPGRPDLAWASFPCQDMSLAGQRDGLRGDRSGTFWPFWNVVQAMSNDGRRIPVVVLENVVGAITAHNGGDFQAIIAALVAGGYRAGALVMDAVHFLPQSRPRLFIVGVGEDVPIDRELVCDRPSSVFHSKSLREAYHSFPADIAEKWVWWRIAGPPRRRQTLTDVIDEDPSGIDWHTSEETQKLLGLMNDRHLRKVRCAQAIGKRIVGAIYKRTRKDARGNKVQRAEVRFDQISGCLRTPAGGSSRQTIIEVEGRRTRTRLLSAREAARLMGVPEDYELPHNYNEAYQLMGDGLAVPVVSWLEMHILRRLASRSRAAIGVT